MTKSAVIVAAAAEERRSIAQLIKPNDLFSRIHFCSSPQEARFLLANTTVDILLCDTCSPDTETLRVSAELSRLASENHIQLVFFSHRDPIELPLLGNIPSGSHCLSYNSSSRIAADLIQRLLTNATAKQPKNKFLQTDNLLDQNSGIYNRFYFDAFLDQELSRSKLTGRPFSLLLIEPKNEEIPESSGWGDLLPSVVSNIKNQIRTSDLLCRVEKKRLALLLPETNSINAQQVMSRLQENALQSVQDVSFGLKIGMASPNISNQFNRSGLLREAEATF